jgi:signal-transduction protein with cAMP-binding, CBS, and nucleotidyltransferase domain
MSEDPIVLNEERGIFEAVNTMCEQGVRRVPIVDGDGRLSGILSLDDLIMIFGEEMASIAGVVAYGSSRSPAKEDRRRIGSAAPREEADSARK